jgi:hypothetical protein
MSLRGLFVKNYREGKHFNTGLGENTSAAWEECLQKVRSLSACEIEAHQVFKGHMRFGLHEILPWPARYITFLRDPVKRALSHYRMALRKGELPPGHRIDPSRPGWNMEACPTVARSLDNGQTRAIAGTDFDLPFGACNADHLRLAKRNLDRHFDFVGLTEHFDLSLMLLGRVCGWKWHFYVPDNVAPPEPLLISAEIEEDIRTLNSLDMELYRYAEERLAALAQCEGWKFKMEHRAFRICNAVHQGLHTWRRARKECRGASVRPAMRAISAFPATLTKA